VASDLAAWLPHLPESGAVFADSAFQTGVMLFLSLGTAFYGSFKVGALQREAMAAREQVRELGQYRLVRSLGVGAMGEVHLAEHRLLKRPCAVKLVRPERTGDAQALARFEREVQSTARLVHPNIVEIYDYGRTEDGTFYYVMEYLEGLNLEELVGRYGRMPPGRSLHIVLQLSRALREAHREGLVHRDIKPSNVFICRRGGVYDVVKLLDFGLVQAMTGEESDSRLTRDGAILGTPDYMPPEQADSPLSVDGRSDIYALGGVLHFMLTGHPPFARDTMMATLVAHRQEAPRPLADLGCEVSRELESLLRKCLAKSPADRFNDVALLASAAESCPERGEWDEERSRCWWQSQPELDAAM
jgi:serine/threonine-protein kinase